jgi:hypothetical protein
MIPLPLTAFGYEPVHITAIFFIDEIDCIVRRPVLSTVRKCSSLEHPSFDSGST